MRATIEDTDLSPLARIFLRPGEVYITNEPTVVSTVLGSCVSVTMYHPRSRTAAMCHAMLPRKGVSSEREALRFVDHAMSHMLDELLKLGIRREEIVVKLFGGSDVISVIKGTATVGEQNVEKALEIIDREHLHLYAQDVRGDRGRKILFHTHTGDILLKRVRKTYSSDN